MHLNIGNRVRAIMTLLLMSSLAMISIQATTAPSLESQLRALCGNSGLGKATIAISVRDCADGRALASINADQSMIPASNMKIISTGSALHALGGNFMFKTALHRDGNDLILRGDGDPTLGDPEFHGELSFKNAQGRVVKVDDEAILKFWTDAVGESKLPQVDRLIIDDTIFDAVRVHPSWPADQLNRYYCAEVAGVNFHRNVIHFKPVPGSDGRGNWNNHQPHAPWLLKAAKNKSANAQGKQKHTPWVAGKAASANFEFRGRVKSGNTVPVAVTIEDPSLFLGQLLADRLQKSGTPVKGIHRMNQPGNPAPATILGPRFQTPIKLVIEQCNEESENLYAESLLKRTVHEKTGRPGSWDEADQVVKQIAREQLKAPAHELLKGVRIADGSGMSRDNRVTARFMTAWLADLQADPAFGEFFVSSLAHGGTEGTLKDRFSRNLPGGAKVDAKTGYIRGVSCLSGYVTMPDGRRYAFSVLVNNVKGTTQPAKRLQEKVVEQIARHFSP